MAAGKSATPASLPLALSSEEWLRQPFRAQSVGQGGIIRRKGSDVGRLVGRASLLREVERRGVPVVGNAGQFIIFCNYEPVVILRRPDCLPQICWNKFTKRFKEICMAPSSTVAMTRPAKHSLTLNGHRTSVSLEMAFWLAFREIAEAEGKAVNQLAAQIDAGRQGDVGLASAIRLYVLQHYRRRLGLRHT